MSADNKSSGGGSTQEQRMAAAASALGLKVQVTKEGLARLQMKIKSDMLNGHNVCHGGFIFTLASTAVDCASGLNQRREMASECSIEFLRPARQGDTLTAEVNEAGSTRRSKICDVGIINQEGDTVALFRGRSISTPDNDAG